MLWRCAGPVVLHACVAVAVLSAHLASPVAERPRIPVPGETQLEKARQLAREVYGTEYESAKTPDQVGAFVEKLLKQAGAMGPDPAGRFVTLKLAADAASRAGDGRTALTVIDRIAETFEVDGLGMKAQFVAEMAEGARLRNQHRAVVVFALELIPEAASQDKFDAANRLCKLAGAAAQKARDPALAKTIAILQKEVREAEKDFAQVQTVRRMLQDSPVNPEARRIIGRYLCLNKGKWDEGLAMLAQGSDPELKALAAADVRGPTEPERQVDLGDRWWQCAEGLDGAAQWHVQTRAAYWYRQALPQTTGLTKAKLQKRLESIPPGPPSRLAVPVPVVRIANVNSGLCLAVRGGSKQSGAPIRQEVFQESAQEQQWRIIPLDAEWSAILNRKSGQSLANSAGSKQPGVDIIQWPLTKTSKEHQWRLVPVASGVFGIINRNSGLCVAVSQGSKQPGGGVIQWPFNETSKEQLWRIDPVRP